MIHDTPPDIERAGRGKFRRIPPDERNAAEGSLFAPRRHLAADNPPERSEIAPRTIRGIRRKGTNLLHHVLRQNLGHLPYPSTKFPIELVALVVAL